MADCSPKKSAIKGVTPMNQFDRGNASPPKTVQAPICPYCGGTSIFLNSSAKIYGGRDYGPVWYCDKDQAWVGCHRGTMSPLGRLANAELRKLKMNVHAVFDPIWLRRYETKSALDPKYRKHMARNGRYKRLAELMGIPRERCHVGRFDEAQCRQAIEICNSGALEKDG